MPAQDAASDVLAGALIGDETVTLFTNENAEIGVGDDNTAHSSAHTQLQAEVNAGDFLYKGMVAGYPQLDPDGDGSDNLVQFQATFGTDEANFTWEEWGVRAGGVLFNRAVETVGTKTSNEQWVFEVDIEINVA